VEKKNVLGRSLGESSQGHVANPERHLPKPSLRLVHATQRIKAFEKDHLGHILITFLAWKKINAITPPAVVPRNYSSSPLDNTIRRSLLGSGCMVGYKRIKWMSVLTGTDEDNRFPTSLLAVTA
jgi:hypothetical protein